MQHIVEVLYYRGNIHPLSTHRVLKIPTHFVERERGFIVCFWYFHYDSETSINNSCGT